LDQVARKPSTWRQVWNSWVKFAHILGTVQMIVILSAVYWTLLMVTALVFKLFADPLAHRGPQHGGWVKRESSPTSLDGMAEQG
jgi:hypothetical protein